MNKLLKALDTFIIPTLLVVTWLILVVTSDVHGVAAGVVLVAFLMVMFLWFTYRELRVHAAAARMAANGEPEELLALADQQIARRLTARSRVPFHIYRSIAQEMAGDRAAAEKALEAAELGRLRGQGRSSWTVLHASQRIGLAADAGDAAKAREILEQELRPSVGSVSGAGAVVIASECEARVLFAEGKLDEAQKIFEKLGKDIRLGQSTRALCRYYVGKCLEARDPEAAKAAFAEAAKLAPRTWMAAAQKLPTSANPAPSAET